MPTYDLGSSTFQLTIRDPQLFQLFLILATLGQICMCQYLSTYSFLCYKYPNRASNILSCPSGFQLTFSALLTHQPFFHQIGFVRWVFTQLKVVEMQARLEDNLIKETSPSCAALAN